MSEINTNENKAKLWNECLKRNYFNKIPENFQENIQKKFEESVTMFSSQNTSNNSLDYINEQILKHFHDELISFTSYDKGAIIDERKKNNNPLKGEIILIVGGYVKEKFDIETLSVIIKNKLERLSIRDTVNEVISETNLPRRVIYNEAIKIRNDLYKKI